MPRAGRARAGAGVGRGARLELGDALSASCGTIAGPAPAALPAAPAASTSTAPAPCLVVVRCCAYHVLPESHRAHPAPRHVRTALVPPSRSPSAQALTEARCRRAAARAAPAPRAANAPAPRRPPTRRTRRRARRKRRPPSRAAPRRAARAVLTRDSLRSSHSHRTVSDGPALTVCKHHRLQCGTLFINEECSDGTKRAPTRCRRLDS